MLMEIINLPAKIDPTIPPVLASGEPDWSRMEGRRHGQPPTEEEVVMEAELLTQ